MPDPATMLGGGSLALGAVGLGTSLFGDDGSDAQNNATNAQTASTAAQLQLARDQWDYQKSLNEPFYNAGLPAYYSLVSAITGQPQTYYMPGGASGSAGAKLTDAEIQDANIAAIKQAQPGWTDTQVQQMMAFYPNYLPYKAGGTYYRDANGGVTQDITQAPGTMRTAEVWQPTETPAYKWQQEQMAKNTSRSLRALGRENSSYGMGEQYKANQNLAATEYDKQLGRLADLTNVARGGASALSGASTAYANQSGQTLGNYGNNMANASLAGGMLSQNSLYNGIQSGLSAANLGLKAYNAYNPSGTTANWTGMDSAYNTALANNSVDPFTPVGFGG